MSLQRFKVLTFDAVGTSIDFERGMVEYVRSVLPAGAMPADDALFDAQKHSRADAAAGEGYRDSVLRWPAFPDSAVALKRLRGRYRPVAMTNARNWAPAHMARTLGDTITVDDVGVEKPDPQFFAFARGRLSAAGYGLPDALRVAQGRHHDFGVARRPGHAVRRIERRLGLQGFGASKDLAEVTRPDHRFASLAELADAVDAGCRHG